MKTSEPGSAQEHGDAAFRGRGQFSGLSYDATDPANIQHARAADRRRAIPGLEGLSVSASQPFAMIAGGSMCTEDT
jgi:hypothetical protein